MAHPLPHHSSSYGPNDSKLTMNDDDNEWPTLAESIIHPISRRSPKKVDHKQTNENKCESPLSQPASLDPSHHLTAPLPSPLLPLPPLIEKAFTLTPPGILGYVLDAIDCIMITFKCQYRRQHAPPSSRSTCDVLHIKGPPQLVTIPLTQVPWIH
jgi:hypothetical protein